MTSRDQGSQLLMRGPARDIFQAVKDLPIISPHGHVPVEWLADDMSFRDATSLLVTPDHYITRLLHANGAELSDLGVARTDFTPEESRAAFRFLGTHWSDFLGTPMRSWMEQELAGIFGISTVLNAETADDIYDIVTDALRTPDFRPRALLARFNVEILTTTEDPTSDLSRHEKLARDPTFTQRVVPTFRPDAYLEAGRPGWPALVLKLSESAGVDACSPEGFSDAMRMRRTYFKAHGAIASDHSHRDLGSSRLSQPELHRIFAAAMTGGATAGEADALRRHLFNDQARMAQDDGLVMTVHPSIARNHDRPGFELYGADIGSDIPIGTSFVEPLQPLLNAYGNNSAFHFVAYTTDETVYSREIAPMAGYYRCFYIGDPWWFIDAPDAIGRFRRAVTESAGFSRQAGFVDDTRALCSIPARHDMSRRTIAVHLGNLVTEGRLSSDDAVLVARALVQTNPRKVFKL